MEAQTWRYKKVKSELTWCELRLDDSGSADLYAPFFSVCACVCVRVGARLWLVDVRLHVRVAAGQNIGMGWGVRIQGSFQFFCGGFACLGFIEELE
jgi:hypothetical protein